MDLVLVFEHVCCALLAMALSIDDYGILRAPGTNSPNDQIVDDDDDEFVAGWQLVIVEYYLEQNSD